MQSLSPNELHPYCRGQKLSAGVLCDCKCAAVIAQLTTTMFPYGLTPLKSAPSSGRTGPPSNTWFMGPPESAPQMA